MLKTAELSVPDSCINKALDDEMVFVLLARDEAAPQAIASWVRNRVELGKNQAGDELICEALECARIMESSRAEIRKRLGKDSPAGKPAIEKPSPASVIGMIRNFRDRVDNWLRHGQPDNAETSADLEATAHLHFHRRPPAALPYRVSIGAVSADIDSLNITSSSNSKRPYCLHGPSGLRIAITQQQMMDIMHCWMRIHSEPGVLYVEDDSNTSFFFCKK